MARRGDRIDKIKKPITAAQIGRHVGKISIAMQNKTPPTMAYHHGTRVYVLFVFQGAMEAERNHTDSMFKYDLSYHERRTHRMCVQEGPRKK